MISRHFNVPHLSTLFAAALLGCFLAACGPADSDEGDPNGPTVIRNLPTDGAIDVARNASINVTFSAAMDHATLTASTFTVTTGSPAVAVAGTVTYGNAKAEFFPAEHLAPGAAYTATITTGAHSSLGLALKEQRRWTFTVGTTVAGAAPVELGTAGNYVILAKSGISTVPPSVITGNLAVSPAAASYITGFSLSADATNVFSSSPQVTGRIYAADYASPSPSNLTTAVSDMELALTAAAARAADVGELGTGNIGGMTLEPGVYKWSSSVVLPADLTLTGDASAVWIFQIAQDLTLSEATRVALSGGALAKNVFWQVSGAVELGTTSHLEGIVLSQTSITLRTGATVNGRLLSQTAVDLDSNSIVQPAP
jgi:hypothetical protein